MDIRASAQRTWITPSLVAANVLVYLVMALTTGKLGGFDPQEYANWGANIGPMTLGGPVVAPAHGGFRPLQVVACLGITSAALLTGLWHMHALGPRLTTPEQYAQQHAAYAKTEAENLRLWREVAGRATAYNLTPKQLADRFDKDIRPFWSESSARLHKELPASPPQQKWFAQLVADEALARLEWARMIIEAARTQQRSAPENLRK